MTGMLVAVAVILAGLGVWSIVAGSQQRPVKPRIRRERGLRSRLLSRGSTHTLTAVAAVGGGVAGYLLTHWLVALVLVPAAVWMLPKLLGQAPSSDIQLLEALDKWVRSLATLMDRGSAVEAALKQSLPAAPEILAADLVVLVRHLNAQMPTADALVAFANRIDSAEADGPIASIILATRKQAGVSQNLVAVADDIQHRLQTLRLVEAERKKPRTEVRQITLITLAMFVGLAVLAPSFLAPLSTPIGQLVVAAAGALYIGSLYQMHRITKPRRRPRILVEQHP